MGNKNKNSNKIEIITDKPKNVEYTFIDDISPKINITPDNKQSKKEDISYSLRRDKSKSTTNSLRFKSSNRKAQSRQNHSPVYE
jgi:hypothetical protein